MVVIVDFDAIAKIMMLLLLISCLAYADDFYLILSSMIPVVIEATSDGLLLFEA